MSDLNSHGSNTRFASRCTQAVRNPQDFAPITSKGLLEIIQTISFFTCDRSTRYSYTAGSGLKVRMPSTLTISLIYGDNFACSSRPCTAFSVPLEQATIP